MLHDFQYIKVLDKLSLLRVFHKFLNVAYETVFLTIIYNILKYILLDFFQKYLAELSDMKRKKLPTGNIDNILKRLAGCRCYET